MIVKYRKHTSKRYPKYYRGDDRSALQATLRDNNFRSTEGRLELLSALKNSHKPVSVPEIASRLSNQLDEVNVYRALEALTQKGILVRTDLRRGGAYYEFAHGHHHHVVCDTCGKTEDIENCGDKSLERRALQNSARFVSISSHALEFFGTCSSCAARV